MFIVARHRQAACELREAVGREGAVKATSLPRREHREELAERFAEASGVLADFDLDEIWDEATADERRTIVEDLLDSVLFYPYQLMVQVLGAPPILVTLEEAGLRVGTRICCVGGPTSTIPDWRLGGWAPLSSHQSALR